MMNTFSLKSALTNSNKKEKERQKEGKGEGKEGRKEGTNERRKEGRNEGTKERRKEGRNEGRNEGTKERRKEGRKEGRKEERKEGMKERNLCRTYWSSRLKDNSRSARCLRHSCRTDRCDSCVSLGHHKSTHTHSTPTNRTTHRYHSLHLATQYIYNFFFKLYTR